MTSWLQVHLEIAKDEAPLAELALESLGALSVTLGDAADEALLEPPPGALPLWQRTRATGLFDAEAIGRAALEQRVRAGLRPEWLATLRIEALADRQWERAWLDDFHPMRFGERLWICPDGQIAEGPDPVVVELDPGLAFGTGTHPTTALCLRWLDAHPPAGLQVIDFGCGSGVLALAAAKLGAKRVIALDHDPQALAATADNARKNGVAERIEILPAGASPDAPADLVLANILAGTLIELAPQITGLTRPGGRIVLSGVLATQATTVAQAYRNDFAMQPPVQQEDWVLLSGRNESP